MFNCMFYCAFRAIAGLMFLGGNSERYRIKLIEYIQEQSVITLNHEAFSLEEYLKWRSSSSYTLISYSRRRWRSMQIVRECKFSNIKNFRTHSGLVFLCYLNFVLSEHWTSFAWYFAGLECALSIFPIIWY